MSPPLGVGICALLATFPLLSLVVSAPVDHFHVAAVVNPATSSSPAIRWVAVGIAAVLAILQGIISALTAQCSAARWWTVRFWILRNEHIYWTFVVLLLCISVGLNITYILQSGTDESTSLLVTAATIGVVTYQYLITTWSQAHFRRAWWLAWTGRSRTRIQDNLAAWMHVSGADALKLAVRVPSSPIERGAGFLGSWTARHRQVRADPTDILRGLSKGALPGLQLQPSQKGPPYAARTTFGETFPDLHMAPSGTTDPLAGLSLLWGGAESIFARRVSRAIESIDGDMWQRIAAGDGSYIMRWAALSHGILGRNKGLAPFLLAAPGLDAPGQLSIFEEHSSLGPRPAKTKRSFVREHMNAIYGTLPDSYRLLATELALLLEDVGPARVEDWLRYEGEHQDWKLACSVAGAPQTGRVLYRLSYLAMVASLNFGSRDDNTPYLRPEVMLADAFGARVEPGWTQPTTKDWSARLALEQKANPGCQQWLDRVKA